jgi:hypothetical protein
VYTEAKTETVQKSTLLWKVRSRIREHTISLRFLGITLRVIRLEVSVYNVYITHQIQTTFTQGGGGGGGKILK